MNASGIGAACPDDAEAVADLMGELGYPATVSEYLARIERLERRVGNQPLVAEDASPEIVGCIHGLVRESLTVDGEAEIGALVVRDQCRRRASGAHWFGRSRNGRARPAVTRFG
jgi:hypothetical protein